MSEKIYRVQMNSKGMPNFSTAVEIEDIPIYGNEHNCMMTIFGECSYAETGCGDCAVVEKVRKALSADRPQGEWIRTAEEYIGDDVSGFYDYHWACSECEKEAIINEWNIYELSDYCPHCGAKMKGTDDE